MAALANIHFSTECEDGDIQPLKTFNSSADGEKPFNKTQENDSDDESPEGGLRVSLLLLY